MAEPNWGEPVSTRIAAAATRIRVAGISLNAIFRPASSLAGGEGRTGQKAATESWKRPPREIPRRETRSAGPRPEARRSPEPVEGRPVHPSDGATTTARRPSAPKRNTPPRPQGQPGGSAIPTFSPRGSQCQRRFLSQAASGRNTESCPPLALSTGRGGGNTYLADRWRDCECCIRRSSRLEARSETAVRYVPLRRSPPLEKATACSLRRRRPNSRRLRPSCRRANPSRARLEQRAVENESAPVGQQTDHPASCPRAL